MKKIVIIDYKLSNLFSVKNALDLFHVNAEISSDKNKLLTADAAILPGVGAFGEAMDSLKRLDLLQPICDFIHSGKPFMGICLGLQLLFSESEEFGTHKGLDIIEGLVRNLRNQVNTNKVPQVGWNTIIKTDRNGDGQSTALDVVHNGDYFYFVHSFYVKPSQKQVVLTTTNYEGFEYCSSVKYDNVFASQFHPEKSGPLGLKVLRRFLEINNLLEEDHGI